MANNLLERLEGLVSRFEEVSTLITDPSVIADQKRYVKLTKEYKDLGRIVDARKEYVGCLQNIADAKEMLAMEEDAETREMLREELSESEKRKYLFLKQINTLNAFRERNAISKEQYDISYNGLISKMGITEKDSVSSAGRGKMKFV